MKMTLSRNGRLLIEQREGERLFVYLDSAGYRTAGVGHKLPTYSDLKVGDAITQDQCDKWLDEDIAYACNDVNDEVDVAITQDQFDALVSFVFNVGCEAFVNSTLLRLLNMGDYVSAQKQFVLWDKKHITVAGKLVKVVDKGLLNRRLAEAAQFGTVRAAPVSVPQLSAASPQHDAAPAPPRPAEPDSRAIDTPLGKLHAGAMALGAAALASGAMLQDVRTAFVLGVGALGTCAVAFVRHHRSL